MFPGVWRESSGQWEHVASSLVLGLDAGVVVRIPMLVILEAT